MTSRLSLLGPVRLTADTGVPLRRASQQRRLALLAIVAASPRASVSRDRLLGLLWPDRDEPTARHLLADSLYVLRRTLGYDAIVTAGDTLHLDHTTVWTDVMEFQAALGEGRWSDALALYRGEFLEGFNLRNAADFDPWALNERNRFQALALGAASEWSRALELEGRLTEAAVAAERALQIAPCDETVFRGAVRLLLAAGNRGRAQLVSRAFVKRFMAEIGSQPSADTMRLVREERLAGNSRAIGVMPATSQRVPRHRAANAATAAMIAQARFYWHQRTAASVERAIRYFTRAIERDPRAIAAWTGLADCWIVMGGRGYAPVPYAIARANDAADRAFAIDDTTSAVHTSLGGVNILRRRWQDAESSLRRAIALDPDNADARHWLALTLLTGYGDRDTSIREQAMAARLNPIAAMQIGALAWQRYLRAEYALSRSEMEPVVDLNADLEEAHAGLARVAARLGDETAVMATIAAGLTRRGDLRGDLLAEQASALAVLGDTERARRLATEAGAHGAMPVHLALAWASIGDADRAFDALARESFRVYWTPHAIWWDPRLHAIRDDRRFARVREQVARAWAPAWDG